MGTADSVCALGGSPDNNFHTMIPAKLVDFVIIISLIVGISLLLWYIFGNSPTDIQIFLAVGTIISGSIFKLFMMSYATNREVGELRKDVENIQIAIHDTKTGIGIIRQSLGKETS